MNTTHSRLTTLGRSQVHVSRTGLGTAPLAGLYRPVPAPEATAVVHDALAAGMTYLDAAPLYGLGLAERRLGDALACYEGLRPVVSTKAGRLLREGTAVFDFSREGILRSLEESLARLRLDRVDIVYLHDPDDHLDQALDVAYPVLHELRAQGVVGAIGAGMNQSAALTRFVRDTDVDAVLLAGRYTLLDTSAAQDLLPMAADRGVSVVVGGVFNSGVLADPRGAAMFDYAPAPAHLLRRALELEQVCLRHGVPLLAAAAQFPLGHPATGCVLVGATDTRELAQDLAAFQHPIPADLWTELQETGLLPDHVPVPATRHCA
ncbi:aldo/keto reductase [Streptacidiphilus sp. EB103A]|uniref:aldo/keto reductase n=1 Tax=Streptacidiphilus sp. EB103A TaxID=3156275 RepID=UPI00351163F7